MIIDNMIDMLIFLGLLVL